MRCGVKDDSSTLRAEESVFFPQSVITKGGPCDDGTPETGRNRENAFTHADFVLFREVGYAGAGRGTFEKSRVKTTGR